MRVLFDDEIDVHYGFAFLGPAFPWPDPGETRAGQHNGLCGAAAPGWLSFVTGLHTGEVPFRVEFHEVEPPIDPAWEEVVEVTFVPSSPALTLFTFDQTYALERLPAGVTRHRVRYLCAGMDAAHATDVRSAGDPPLDRYLVQLWPAPDAPTTDAVVTQTSAQAAYWHSLG